MFAVPRALTSTLWSPRLSRHYRPVSCLTPFGQVAYRYNMDTEIADAKLKELHVEELRVQANDRRIAQFDIDPVKEKQLLRKLDIRVVPVLWFLFMLGFLDRANIGMRRVSLGDGCE